MVQASWDQVPMTGREGVGGREGVVLDLGDEVADREGDAGLDDEGGAKLGGLLLLGEELETGLTVLGLELVALELQELFLGFHGLPVLLIALADLFLVGLDLLEVLPGKMEGHRGSKAVVGWETSVMANVLGAGDCR